MPAPAAPTLRLARANLDWRAVEGEILALDTSSAEYLSVNRTGALLWHELAAGTSRAQLIAALTANAGIDSVRAGRDVDAFLGQLAEQGLLIAEPSPPEAPAGD